MLEIRDLCAGYPGKRVLRHVNVSIPSGALTVILGPNGCGKSTLLKSICGLIPTQSGCVTLDGERLTGMEPRLLAQRAAYLAQNRQIPDIAAKRLVLHGRFPYLSYPRKYRPQDEEIALQAMEQMGVAHLADENVNQLSGGQRQKVYIAMALAQQTPVILLDEPTTYLDIRHQLQMMKEAKRLAAQGKTVVMIIHDLPHALEAADQVILMNQGEIVIRDTPQAVYDSREIERTFGVRIGRVHTERGDKYYCEEN
ncbi:MAG: ABC transporter ATP-binding protein [Eubacteriales bacterium]|nr:ABC transporter ATP-binding protein [Eubacteriales bacterium]